jgi:hypothetical protein
MTKPVLVREISKRKGRARQFRFFICFSNEADVQGQLGKQPLLNINFRKNPSWKAIKRKSRETIF